ncbi:MAG: hypothetical protein ACK2T6_06030 [Anaerolineae bacterium]
MLAGCSEPVAGQPSPTATLNPTTAVSPTSEPSAAATSSPESSPTATPGAPRVLLPWVARRASLASAKTRAWGLQFSLEDDPELYAAYAAVELPRARKLGLRSVRTNLRWDLVEPERTTGPGELDWRLYDERLATYSTAGFDVMVTLVAYPAWATRYQCGMELLPGMEPEWREFVREAALRYSREPYRVAAWEIGNEVDGKTAVVDADFERSEDWGGGQPTTPYGGCWGDRAPQYVEFLRAAYEEIKAVDPDVLVTHGGLANVDLFDHFGYDLFHMDFLDRFLEAGGAEYFDFFNYHWFPDVDPRYQPPGPVKHRQLMAKLRAHGVDVPVWLTETYRLSDPTRPDGELGQVDFATREVVEMLGFPVIDRVYWYGWVDFPARYKPEPNKPDRGAVRADHSAKPVVSVLPYTIQHTAGRPTNISTDAVSGYRFAWPRERREYVVAWPLVEGGPVTLELPAAPGSRALVTTFPREMLLAGECCTQTVVEERDGVIVLTIGGGADEVFAAIDR